MTVSEVESAKMVAGYQSDPKAYFKAHAVDDFLPPLAPAIMERLRRGFGSLEEIDYYDCTLQCHEDLNAHHETEMKNAGKKGGKVVHLSREEIGKKDPFDDDDLPF